LPLLSHRGEFEPKARVRLSAATNARGHGKIKRCDGHNMFVEWFGLAGPEYAEKFRMETDKVYVLYSHEFDASIETK